MWVTIDAINPEALRSPAVPSGLPLPSEDLTFRVFLRSRDEFIETGRVTAEAITAHLPDEWTWDGKKVLEFGCGVGRVLRHLADEALVSDFYGCDIDGPSIAWLEEHLSPPFHVFTNCAQPPIDMPAESFDLIYAVSVFTHLTDQWAPWLLELHRLLKPGGIILSTFQGEGAGRDWWAQQTGEPWDADRVGMLAMHLSTPWSHGGPGVFHSAWWVNDRWGRLFEVEAIAGCGFRPPGFEPDHGFVLARKTEKHCSLEELLRSGDDPRDLAALQFQVDVLYRQGLAARDRPIGARDAIHALRAAVARKARRH